MDILRWFSAALLTAAMPLPQSAAAAASVLEPSDKWVLNYADDSCRLARTFGQGDDQVVLILDQYQPAGLMDLSLVGKRFGWLGPNRVRFSSTFGPGLPSGDFRDAIMGTVGPAKATIVMSGPRDILNRPMVRKTAGVTDEYFPTTPEQEAAVTELRIAASSIRLTLHTGSMGAPLKAMGKCLSDLVQAWELDPAQQAALSKRAAPSGQPGSWLTSNDYPPGPLANGASAIVRFRLMVGADGVPTKCFVQQATMSPEFIKLTCDLLVKRARFSPALDALGKPVPSYYTNSVRWLASL